MEVSHSTWHGIIRLFVSEPLRSSFLHYGSKVSDVVQSTECFVLIVKSPLATLSGVLKAPLCRANKGFIELIFSISLFIPLRIRNKEETKTLGFLLDTKTHRGGALKKCANAPPRDNNKIAFSGKKLQMSYQNAWNPLPGSLLAACYNYCKKDHIDVMNINDRTIK